MGLILLHLVPLNRRAQLAEGFDDGLLDCSFGDTVGAAHLELNSELECTCFGCERLENALIQVVDLAGRNARCTQRERLNRLLLRLST